MFAGFLAYTDGHRIDSIVHLVLRLRGGMYHETSGRFDNAAIGLAKQLAVTVSLGDKSYTLQCDPFAPVAALSTLLKAAVERDAWEDEDSLDSDEEEEEDEEEDEELAALLAEIALAEKTLQLATETLEGRRGGKKARLAVA